MYSMATVTGFLFALLLFVCTCEAYKILVVFPFPARSHNNLGNGYVRHLLKAEHEVTYITPYPLKDNNPKLRQIDVSSNIEIFPENVVNIDAIMRKEMDLNDENTLNFVILNVADKTFDNQNVQKLLNDPKEEFDVVIVEWMFNEVYSGFSAIFNCPYIWAYPYEPYTIIMSLIDGPTNPAYVPYLGSSNVAPFTFVQRIQELWSQVKSLIFKNLYFSNYEQEVYERVFSPILARRGRVLPAYNEIRYNASMMLSSAHVSFGQSVALPQNYKSVAGYYIDENVKPLPEDLQTLMDGAKHGVIYFSLGSNLKSKELSVEIRNGLIAMFGELKETVIWKFEDDYRELPKNVHILKWAPQQSILAHPNCKLFITHGGLLSTTEALHFGVPTIGIPVYVDQFNNVDRAVKSGFAIRVDLSYSLADDLRVAINDILNNPRYTEKAREQSLLYHDRPVSPGAELVHWVGHVVRTRGATHLRSPALALPLYQKMYLDLLAVILAVVILIRSGIKRLTSRKVVNTHKKKN